MLGSLLSVLILALVPAGCAPSVAAPLAQPGAAAAAAVLATAEPQPAQALPTEGGAAVTSAPAAQASGTVVNVVRQAGFGLFLTDAKGMTLYLFTKDTPDISTCYDQCAAAWPPLLTDGAPVAGSGQGMSASLLGATTRKDGKVQVTYNKLPLYYYAKDQKPGDLTGQGVGKVWFVVSPRGRGMTGPYTGTPGPASTPGQAAPTQTPAGNG
jgi:predicted lipoprotein with Yx(FWY)xxD motif